MAKSKEVARRDAEGVASGQLTNRNPEADLSASSNAPQLCDGVLAPAIAFMHYLEPFTPFGPDLEQLISQNSNAKSFAYQTSGHNGIFFEFNASDVLLNSQCFSMDDFTIRKHGQEAFTAL